MKTELTEWLKKEIKEFRKKTLDHVREMESKNVFHLQDHLKTLTTISAWVIWFWVPIYISKIIELKDGLINKPLFLYGMWLMLFVVLIYMIQTGVFLYLQGLDVKKNSIVVKIMELFSNNRLNGWLEINLQLFNLVKYEDILMKIQKFLSLLLVASVFTWLLLLFLSIVLWKP